MSTSLALAGLLGVATHVLYFNKGEHHFRGWQYVQATLAGFATVVGVQVRIYEQTLGKAFTSTLPLITAYFIGLYTSLLIYRAFLNPLNSFPGPFGARISNLWYTTQVGNADAHKVMTKLHNKYGNFVRIGSNELSITHPKSVNAIYGPGTKCTKGQWYDNDYPLTSMHTSRNRALHDRRRRIWSPAFSDKALRGYEERIRPYGSKLVEQLKAFSGKPVNVSEWFNFYSFDVMGDLAFGDSFGMLDSGERHWAIKLLNEGMEPLALMLPSWLFRMITAVPGLAAGYWKFIGYCSERLHTRMNKKKIEVPDIMSSLLEPYEKTGFPTGTELTFLEGDSRLIIVAGSDTTAATLTHVYYHLAHHPDVVERLREEVLPHATAEGDVEHREVQDLPLLNGVINEALRLNPPVPTAVHRMTPPEGLQIGDTFIPGNTDVWCPQYVIARNPEIYEHPEEFIPERWGSKSEMVKEKTAFAPFSAGVYGCIGRPLALIELRTIIVKLVSQFDVSFGPGEDGSALMQKTRDHFTLGLADMSVCFTPRKK